MPGFVTEDLIIALISSTRVFTLLLDKISEHAFFMILIREMQCRAS